MIRTWTGKNGYEEFVKAAILLSTPEFAALDRYVNYRDGSSSSETKAPAGVDPKMSIPALYALELKWAKPALTLVRAGMTKQVFYPNPVSDLTPFPELQAFKVESRLFGRLAEVELAAGREQAATAALTDGLTLSKKIPGAGDIAALVGVSAERIAFQAISKQIRRLSLSSVRSLRKSVELASAAPDTFLEAAQVMQKARRANFYDLFARPGESLGSDQGEDIRLIQSITPAERDKLYEAMFRYFEAPFKAVELRLRGAESAWLGPVDTENVPGFERRFDSRLMAELDAKTRSAGLVVLRYLAPLGYDGYNYENVIRIALTRRVQERILALNCAVVEHRLENGQLPATLKEMLGNEPADPASNGPYRYAANADGTFMLSCKVSGLGDVDLNSK